MAQAPIFPAFSVYNDEQTTGIRWKKWIERFEFLLCTMDVEDDKKKKAMLLTYAGEEVFDIYSRFTDEEKGENVTRRVDKQFVSAEYERLKQSLHEYFTPRRQKSYEIFKFRRAVQQPGKKLDQYYARLRSLASTCDFQDPDSDILAQIIQGCASPHTRRKALREDSTLR